MPILTASKLPNAKKILLSISVGLGSLCAVLTAAASAAALQPLHAGYAFDHPRILVQQRLFGLAHGVTLLAATCVRDPRYHALTLDYAEWNERQAAEIDTSTRDLARYYFGDRAAEATRLDIARALKLRERLDLKSGSKTFHDACATFAEALRKPRYDLRNQYYLQSLAARLEAAAATEAAAGACHGALPEAAAARLDEAMAQWRGTYGAGVGRAKAALERNWQDSQLEGTLEEWLAQAREKGQRGAVAERCNAMPQWLLTEHADPDTEFNAAP